jgi:hypothetical protein
MAPEGVGDSGEHPIEYLTAEGIVEKGDRHEVRDWVLRSIRAHELDLTQKLRLQFVSVSVRLLTEVLVKLDPKHPCERE